MLVAASSPSCIVVRMMAWRTFLSPYNIMCSPCWVKRRTVLVSFFLQCHGYGAMTIMHLVTHHVLTGADDVAEENSDHKNSRRRHWRTHWQFSLSDADSSTVPAGGRTTAIAKVRTRLGVPWYQVPNSFLHTYNLHTEPYSLYGTSCCYAHQRAMRSPSGYPQASVGSGTPTGSVQQRTHSPPTLLCISL